MPPLLLLRSLFPRPRGASGGCCPLSTLCVREEQPLLRQCCVLAGEEGGETSHCPRTHTPSLIHTAGIHHVQNS